MKFVTAAVAAALLTSTPVLAQNFTGPRAEVRLGLDVAGSKLASKYQETIGGVTETEEFSDRGTSTGFAYGLGLGYDVAAGKNFVVGVEANLDFSDTKDCVEEFYDWEDLCLKAGRDIELAVRAGAVVNPSTLVYAKVGYANGRIKMTGWDWWQEEKLSEGKNRDGLRIGAGVETALSSKLYLKVEYSYTDYKDWKTSYTQGTYRDEARLGLDRHKAQAALGVRF